MDKKKIWESYRFPADPFRRNYFRSDPWSDFRRESNGTCTNWQCIHQPAVYGRSTYGFCFYC